MEIRHRKCWQSTESSVNVRQQNVYCCQRIFAVFFRHICWPFLKRHCQFWWYSEMGLHTCETRFLVALSLTVFIYHVLYAVMWNVRGRCREGRRIVSVTKDMTFLTFSSLVLSFLTQHTFFWWSLLLLVNFSFHTTRFGWLIDYGLCTMLCVVVGSCGINLNNIMARWCKTSKIRL